MPAGIGPLKNEDFSSGLPPIKKSWRVMSLSHRSRTLIHQTYPGQAVVRLEYYRHVKGCCYEKIYRSIELALTLGINVEQSDYDVMLGFEDELQAYNFIRYCEEKGIYAHFYTEDCMISSPGLLTFYLNVKDEDLKVKKGTSGEAAFIRGVKKVRQLENQWRQQWR